jgi:predicted ABC-type ATPase
MHVVMVPEHLSVERVGARVRAGGHDVPEHKIRERWRRLWANVVLAAEAADETVFWDNSAHDGPVDVAIVRLGVLDGPARWPDWAPSDLTARWP